MLKPEAYLFRKKIYVERKIAASGLKIIECHQVRLSFSDILRMYPGWMARITMSLRLPNLMPLDLYIVKGESAINAMNQLKYEIRRDLLGSRLGGFLHAPDSPRELSNHISILTQAGLKTSVL